VRGHLLLTNCLEDELTRPNIELAVIFLLAMFKRRGWMGKGK
jgi:hypothetical protein